MEKQSTPPAAKSTAKRTKAEAFARLVRDTRIGHGAVRVFLCLYTYWNTRTGECYPTQRRICNDINCDGHSVKGWVAELVAGQWVSVRSEVSRIGRRHVYTLLDGQGGLLGKTTTGGDGEKRSKTDVENPKRGDVENPNSTNPSVTNPKEHKGKAAPKFFPGEMERRLRTLRETYTRIDLSDTQKLTAVYQKLVEVETEHLGAVVSPERQQIDQDPHLFDLRSQIKEAQGELERATPEEQHGAGLKLQQLKYKEDDQLQRFQSRDRKLCEQIRDGTAKAPAPQHPDRNKGTANEGQAGKYRGLGRIDNPRNFAIPSAQDGGEAHAEAFRRKGIRGTDEDPPKTLLDKMLEAEPLGEVPPSDVPVTEGKKLFQKMREGMDAPNHDIPVGDFAAAKASL